MATTYLDYTLTLLWDALLTAERKIFAQLPQVIVGIAMALLLIIVGWVIGYFAKIVVKNALKALRLDEWAEQHQLHDSIGGLELSSLAGSFVKWYIIIIFIAQATEFVGLASIRTFMNAVTYFAPLALFAAIVVTIGVLLGKFVRYKFEATDHKYKRTIGTVIEFTVVYVMLLVSLRAVGIDIFVLESAFLLAFGAFVLTLALVFGLSIGLAFRDDAKGFIQEFRKNIK